MHKLIESCPVCSGELMIRELECKKCHTKVTSQFDLHKGKLDIDDEILEFIKVFISAEGSIKQSEKLLNCSYPKIKNLLKKTKKALKIEEEKQSATSSVIEQLDQGDIDIEEALKQLKNK